MTITIMMGIVFEIPILCWLFGRLGILSADFMRHYRRPAHCTDTDNRSRHYPYGPTVFTLSIVTLPMYVLYEWSIYIVKHTTQKR